MVLSFYLTIEPCYIRDTYVSPTHIRHLAPIYHGHVVTWFIMKRCAPIKCTLYFFSPFLANSGLDVNKCLAKVKNAEDAALINKPYYSVTIPRHAFKKGGYYILSRHRFFKNIFLYGVF